MTDPKIAVDVRLDIALRNMVAPLHRDLQTRRRSMRQIKDLLLDAHGAALENDNDRVLTLLERSISLLEES